MTDVLLQVLAVGGFVYLFSQLFSAVRSLKSIAENLGTIADRHRQLRSAMEDLGVELNSIYRTLNKDEVPR